MRSSVVIEESVAALGRNIRAARLKRRIPQAVLAERVGVSLSTLAKIEKGYCGVSIGTVASVLNALGLGTPLSDIAAHDPLEMELEGEFLPKRIRSSSKKG